MQFLQTITIKKCAAFILASLLVLFFCVHFTQTSYAISQDYGLKATASKGDIIQYDYPIQKRIGKIIGAALSLTGIIFFILAVYAGFLWMTARGDETQAKKARETIIMAVTGLVIILGAYAITDFVFSSVEPPKKTSAQTNLGPGDFIPQDSNQMAA